MRVPTLEGHRLWAPVYDSGPNPLLALERRAMWNILEPLQATKVIDVACGTGHWLLHLQEAGSDVFGCDFCQEMLDEAQKIFSLRGRLALADAECIPFHTSIADLVLCSVSLGYFHDLDRAFLEFAKASKPGGFIAISDLHPDALSTGWSRSFKLGEQRYELQHYRRSIHEITSAASGAGLEPKLRQDVYFGAAEAPIFQRAGKQELFSRLITTPALFIGLWEKPCC
ncbi:MAG: class I SAM-dependent methyltransferase [Bryobacteraceae bacterium]